MTLEFIQRGLSVAGLTSNFDIVRDLECNICEDILLNSTELNPKATVKDTSVYPLFPSARSISCGSVLAAGVLQNHMLGVSRLSNAIGRFRRGCQATAVRGKIRLRPKARISLNMALRCI